MMIQGVFLKLRGYLESLASPAFVGRRCEAKMESSRSALSPKGSMYPYSIYLDPSKVPI